MDHKFDVEENYLEKNKLILEDVIIEDPQITKELKNGPYSNEATLISRHSSKNHARINHILRDNVSHNTWL